MDQKITVRISGREYCLKASSPENEEVIRKAVTIINQKIQNYQKNFSGKSEIDILTFVALNECIGNIKLNRRLDEGNDEARKLLSDLQTYIDNIEKA